jgi:ABC-2 type transport system permease protein
MKSFIVITLLTPLLLSFLFTLPTHFARQHEDYQPTSAVSIERKALEEAPEKTQLPNNQFQHFLCMALGTGIYLCIFLFSSQVMRGVLEEKSNRIVELIITSISPVRFMTGKIIGIALLGLTQIACWLLVMYGVTYCLSGDSATGLIGGFMDRIDFRVIIPAFLFFFIGGYLLYSSVFAAIAAAANHNDDIQQVTLIVTIPLILSVIVLSSAINTPDSSLVYWFSIIPFTSPVVMMGRMAYGVPFQDVLLSILLLAATVVLMIWISGKVYRMAILYTGKKVSMKEIISWISNAS